MTKHDLVLFRRVRRVGNDGTELRFATPSWTGRKVEHEIVISLHTGEISCTCEDAVCRRKRGHVLDKDTSHLCKHERLIVNWCGAQLRDHFEP